MNHQLRKQIFMRLETVYDRLKQSFDPECDEPLKSFPIFLADELESIEKVMSRVHECQMASLNEQARHKEALKEIDGRLREARFRCGHHVTKFYPDASGNNDSCTICQICGAEL